MVSMDWFEVKGSPAEEGDKEAAEGFTQCLVTDSQTDMWQQSRPDQAAYHIFVKCW